MAQGAFVAVEVVVAALADLGDYGTPRDAAACCISGLFGGGSRDTGMASPQREYSSVFLGYISGSGRGIFGCTGDMWQQVPPTPHLVACGAEAMSGDRTFLLLLPLPAKCKGLSAGH